MEHDLFFILTTKAEWKNYSEKGEFEPSDFEEKGYIDCLLDSQIEKVANLNFTHQTELLLLVIDTSRIQSPIKFVKTPEMIIPRVFGIISVDAIIDKIKLSKDPEKGFSVRVKHID